MFAMFLTGAVAGRLSSSWMSQSLVSRLLEICLAIPCPLEEGEGRQATGRRRGAAWYSGGPEALWGEEVMGVNNYEHSCAFLS